MCIVEFYYEENGIKFGVCSWVYIVKRGMCYFWGKFSFVENLFFILNLVDNM